MIVKTKKGRGFRGVLEYNLREQKGYLLASNMAGNTPRELAREFGAVRALRPKLGKAVQHTSISAAPGEHLTDDQWRAVGERYLQHMGFDDSQALIIRHTDRDHEHIHIIANRVTNTGGVVSDSKDYERQEALMRQLEQDYGLQRVEPSRESPKRAPTRGEIAAYERTGQPSVKVRLQALLDAAIQDCHDFTSFARRLEADGVQVVPTVQQGGAKLTGTLYVLDGEKMKGGDLGKAYTAAGIQKRGVEYEQNRDLKTVRRCRERAGLEREGARPVAGSPDLAGAGAGAEHGAPSDRRGVGAAHRAAAFGAGHGGSVGRDAVGARDGGGDQGGAGSPPPTLRHADSRRTGAGSGRDVARQREHASGLADGAIGAGGADRGAAHRRIAALGRWAEAALGVSGLPARPAGAPAPSPAPTVKKDTRAALDDFWSAEKVQERTAQEKAARAAKAEADRRREQEAQAREARRQQPAPRHDQPPPRPAPRRDTPSRGRSGPSL